MLKRITKLAALAAFAIGIAACGVGNAQAQSIGPINQAKFISSSYTTIDLESVRYVDMTPGANKIVDRNGAVISGTFDMPQSFTYSDAAKHFIKVGNYLYQRQANVSCQAGQTIIYWETSAEVINDSCSRAITVWSVSR